MHDPRLGRFFAIDPLVKDYPWNSPYAFSENMVIHMVELEGLEAAPIGTGINWYEMFGFSEPPANVTYGPGIYTPQMQEQGYWYSRRGDFGFAGIGLFNGVIEGILEVLFLDLPEVTVVAKRSKVVKLDASGGKVIKSSKQRVVVQKGDKTFDITEKRVKEYVKNPKNSKAQYGDAVNFKKKPLPEGSERIKGIQSGKGHKRTLTDSEKEIFKNNKKN
jgi:hypothetical protein